MVLEQEQLRCFFEDGFVVLPQLFDRDEVVQIAAAFDRLQGVACTLPASGMVDGSLFVLDGQQIKRVVWCKGAAPELGRWAEDRRLLGPVFDLLFDPDHVVQLICQAHFKLPRDGVSFPWHQDAQHRRYGTPEWSDVDGRGSYVQTVLAVDAMEADNGPLQLVRGSCRLGPLAPDQVEAHVVPEDVVSLNLAAGSVAMFGPYTIHGSEANNSDNPRRAWINGYAATGANRRQYPGCGLGLRLARPQ